MEILKKKIKSLPRSAVSMKRIKTKNDDSFFVLRVLYQKVVKKHNALLIHTV